MEMEFKPDEQSICDMVYHAVHKAVSKLSSVSLTDKTKQPLQKNPKVVIKIRPNVKIGTNADGRQARMPIPHLWQWPNKRDKVDGDSQDIPCNFLRWSITFCFLSPPSPAVKKQERLWQRPWKRCKRQLLQMAWQNGKETFLICYHRTWNFTIFHISFFLQHSHELLA